MDGRRAGLDLLVGAPRCTPWSPAGRHLGVRDGGDMLRVTVVLIRLLRPRAYASSMNPIVKFGDSLVELHGI
ncbi:hypothetical protein LVJ94_21610 [Pendulispora rubella]|uniref:Uncharacterized protein n=1 Tax=Pendulispora rubella TaxID=2741070 RepID=A0ABZ2LGD2_9BACT